jgi:hypothetical protein
MNTDIKFSVKNKERWLLCGWDINKRLLSIEDLNFKKSFFLKAVGNLLMIISFIKLTNLFLTQKKQIKNVNRIQSCKDLVISSSKKHMHLNYFRHENNLQHIDFELISAFDKKDFTSIVDIGFKDLYKQLFMLKKEINHWISVTDLPLKWLIIKRIFSGSANFSYWILLLNEIKKVNPNIKVFNGGAYLVSCAASIVGIEANYLAHGITQRFVVSPKYNSVSVYSEDELNYYLKSNTTRRVITYDCKKISSYEKSIIIFLDQYDPEDEINFIFELIDFFKKIGFKAIVKNHPAGHELNNLFERDPEIKFIDEFSLDAEYVLRKEMPIFAASGASTSIVEACNMQIVPIIFSQTKLKLSIESAISGIYPFYEKSLLWPEDKKIISEIANSPKEKAFEKFRNYKMGMEAEAGIEPA